MEAFLLVQKGAKRCKEHSTPGNSGAAAKGPARCYSQARTDRCGGHTDGGDSAPPASVVPAAAATATATNANAARDNCEAATIFCIAPEISGQRLSADAFGAPFVLHKRLGMFSCTIGLGIGCAVALGSSCAVALGIE